MTLHTASGRRGMEAIASGLSTKSAKIRAFDAAGYSRSQIADFLQISYQHVRQVLVTARPTKAEGRATAETTSGETEDTRPSMSKVTTGLGTKASKIRVLDAAGYSRSEIAKFLDIRYQHVRNVLVQKSATRVETPRDDGVRRVRALIGPGGRVVVPAEYWRTLGVGEGDTITLELADEDGIRIISGRSALKRAQALVQKYVGRTVSLVDDLIAERRREASDDERRR